MALLAAVAVAAAAPPAAGEPHVQPFMHIEVQAEHDWGTMLGFDGFHDAPDKLEVLLAANFHHGGVVASITDLEHEDGSSAKIGKERIYTRKLHQGAFAPMAQPVQITGPMDPGVHNLPLEFRVERDVSYAPGTYTGTLTLTITGAP